jgi:phage terminase large subunit-like protein
LDIGQAWGAVCLPWQRENAAAVLLPGDGPRLFWHELPKGSSKSTDAAAYSITWLTTQASPGDEGYVVSSDEDQSNRLLNRARVIIRKSPALQSTIKIHAKQIVNTRTHAYVVALAADVSSSEGILSPFVIVDELPRWKTTQSARDLWVSIFSSHPKVARARLLVLGHAGDPAHWSYKIRERARKSRRWRFVHIDGPTPWLDSADLEEQQALLLPSQYAQRYLNIWTAGEDRLASREDVAACVGVHDVLAAKPAVRYVIGLDVGLSNDRCVATIGHRDGSRTMVDRQQVWAGTRDNPVSLDVVEEWLRLAVDEHNHARVVLDPWQAVHLAQRLRADGVTVETFAFTAQSVGRLAVTLFRALKDHNVVLPNDNNLVDEIVNARLRETSPGVFRIDHDTGAHDDRVISLALVTHQLAQQSAGLGGFGGAVMARTSVLGRDLAEQERKALARDLSPWRRHSPWATPVGPWS